MTTTCSALPVDNLLEAFQRGDVANLVAEAVKRASMS